MIVLILGGIFFFLIGIILSLIGSGGAILTIPVLVYLFGVPPYLATTYSLFIMGICNWTATIDNIRQRRVIYKTALFFIVPDLFVTLGIRQFILPKLPPVFWEHHSFFLTKDGAIMLVFGLLVLGAALRTLLSKEKAIERVPETFNYRAMIWQGSIVGIVTGFVGAGGGFILVPLLLLYSKIPMKYAVATSLFIIAVTTSIGFLGDLHIVEFMDWKLLIFGTFTAVAGVLFSNPFKEKISNEFLKNMYGMVIFILGIAVLITEFLKLPIK